MFVRYSLFGGGDSGSGGIFEKFCFCGVSIFV